VGYDWTEGGNISKDQYGRFIDARTGRYYGGGGPSVPGEPQAPAPAQSAAPNFIGAPPPILGGGGEDGGENVYKDPNGVFRNRRQDTSGGRAGSGGNTPMFSAYNKAVGGGGDEGGQAGGQNAGQGSTGTVGGVPAGGGGGRGGGMPVMQDTRMSSKLDPAIWNTPITGGGATQSAGQAGGYASALANINPSVGAPDRTLYDKYSQFLQGGMAGMGNDPGVQFQLQQAQQANQRQLNAGRNRNSGRALEEMSATTTGNLMQQFGNLSSIYGQGAGVEGQRWGQEQGLNLDAQKLKLASLQGAGDLAVRSGQLYNQNDSTGIQARQLDLQRSQANIMTPNQQQGTDIRAQATQQANTPGNYGTWSPNLSQQYLSLTGTPLTMSYTGGMPSSAYQPGFGGSYSVR
jgi:hypothetical protein